MALHICFGTFFTLFSAALHALVVKFETKTALSTILFLAAVRVRGYNVYGLAPQTQ